MAYDPCPIMMVQPTVDLAKTFSKDRLDPMLRDTPVLRGKVKKKRTKDADNTVLHKSFPGGHYTLVGANAPSGIASRPIRVVLADEIDRWPKSVGEEGSGLTLVKKRQTTFWNKKALQGSTPTIKGESHVEAEFEQSDKRYYFVPCPDCGHMQRLVWKNLIWEEGNPETARYMCEECAVLIEHKRKKWMLDRGEWRATAEFKGHAGFHISELYSPWSSWSDMATNFLNAQGDTEKLKAFVNTSLGETWEEAGEEIDPESLQTHRESYSHPVPREVLVIVCTVDVQKDWFDYEFRGFGVDEESWGISKGQIYGDLSQKEPWEELDEVLGTVFEHEYGYKMTAAITFIDSGGLSTKAVYDFCFSRMSRRIYAIKGNHGYGIPLVTLSKPRKSKDRKKQGRLYLIGVDEAKRIVTQRFTIKNPGPGYYHFPISYDDEYFNQCAAEKRVKKYKRGFAFYEWQKIRARNEALDLNAYAYAAIKLLNPTWEKLQDKYKMPENFLQKMPKLPESLQNTSIIEEIPQENTKTITKKPRPVRRRSNWVHGWKK